MCYRNVLAATAVVAMIVGGCGTTPDRNEPPSNDIVLDRIASMSDCDDLQRQFDIADGNGRVDYMRAADARLKAVGCY